MPILSKQWVVLADGNPPSLVVNAPASTLESVQTPSATGISATAEGYLSTGTIPTGTARTSKAYTVGGTAYQWHFNRLWAISAHKLIYGAPEYTATYFKQNIGEIDYRDANFSTGTTEYSILAYLPIGTSKLIALKANGAFIVENANDHDGNFRVGDFMQEAFISTATHAVELDGTVYFVNTLGVFSVDENGLVLELSYPLRGSIPTAAAMTADYSRKFVIVGSTHVYDVNKKRWLKYSGSTFDYYSRELSNTDASPMSVEEIAFEYDRTTGDDATIEFVTKVDSRGWSPNTYVVQAPYDRATHNWASIQVEAEMGRTFQLRITSLPSSVKIKRILASVSGYTNDSRGS